MIDDLVEMDVKPKLADDDKMDVISLVLLLVVNW
jgi:hypothetical protein